MKLCRFTNQPGEARIGLVLDYAVLDLTQAGITTLQTVLESDDPPALLSRVRHSKLPQIPLQALDPSADPPGRPGSFQLAAPVERQEVWAAGVTYLRSKAARMQESNFSPTAYDRVYEAERPELFFKSLAEKVVGPDQAVGIRCDSRWSVPEPELALVLNSRGTVVGYTIGNDMSARDIEGENLLYLPQAKIYSRSCALGPWISLGATEQTAREWKVTLEIQRGQTLLFSGETTIGNIKRRLDHLASFLFRCQSFPHGAILLSGTGIVPPDSFALQEGDQVRIDISGIGSLRNHVVLV